jgi:hypothetical protein
VLLAPALLGTFCLGRNGRECVDAEDTDCLMWGVRTQSLAGDAGVVFIEADGGCSTPLDAGACAVCAEAECCVPLTACPAGASCPALDDCLRASCASLCTEVP